MLSCEIREPTGDSVNLRTCTHSAGFSRQIHSGPVIAIKQDSQKAVLLNHINIFILLICVNVSAIHKYLIIRYLHQRCQNHLCKILGMSKLVKVDETSVLNDLTLIWCHRKYIEINLCCLTILNYISLDIIKLVIL